MRSCSSRTHGGRVAANGSARPPVGALSEAPARPPWCRRRRPRCPGPVPAVAAEGFGARLRFFRPLRRPPSGMPAPSSAAVNRTLCLPSGRVTVVSTRTWVREASACRNALEGVSRRAAMRFLPVRSPTFVSTGPTKRCEGLKPSDTAAMLISRSTRVRSPEGTSAGPCRNAKIAVRIIWMVTSSSSTALPTRSCTSGTTDMRWALSRIIPVTNQPLDDEVELLRGRSVVAGRMSRGVCRSVSRPRPAGPPPPPAPPSPAAALPQRPVRCTAPAAPLGPRRAR